MKLDVRRHVIARLAAIGLSAIEIAEAMNLSEETIRADFFNLTGEKLAVDQNLSQRRKESWRKGWRIYVEFYLTQKGERLGKRGKGDIETGVLEVLAKHLEISRLRGAAEGIAEIINLSVNPRPAPGAHRNLPGCRSFIIAIFQDSPLRVTGEQLFMEYLLRIREGEDDAIPETQEIFLERLSEWAHAEFAPLFRPAFTATALEAVEGAFKILNPRQEKMMRLRFNISSPEFPVEKAFTLVESAKALALNSKAHALQIHQSAIHKIRHSPWVQTLGFWVMPLATTSEQWLRENMRKTPSEFNGEVSVKAFEAVLNRPVTELGLDVHAQNCLRQAGIKTVRQLVEKTKAEMLEVPNLGKRTFEKIETVVKNLGLEFGMKFDDS